MTVGIWYRLLDQEPGDLSLNPQAVMKLTNHDLRSVISSQPNLLLKVVVRIKGNIMSDVPWWMIRRIKCRLKYSHNNDDAQNCTEKLVIWHSMCCFTRNWIGLGSFGVTAELRCITRHVISLLSFGEKK